MDVNVGSLMVEEGEREVWKGGELLVSDLEWRRVL